MIGIKWAAWPSGGAFANRKDGYAARRNGPLSGSACGPCVTPGTTYTRAWKVARADGRSQRSCPDCTRNRFFAGRVDTTLPLPMREPRSLNRGLMSGSGSLLALAMMLVMPMPGARAQSAILDSIRPLVTGVPLTGTLQDSIVLQRLSIMSSEALNAGAVDTTLAVTGRCIGILERFTGADAEAPFTLKQFALAYRRRGLALQDKGDYPGSLKSIQQYQLYAERLGNVKETGASYVLMAACFREMQDTLKAIELSRKAIGLLRSIPPGKDLGQAYMGLGGIYANSSNTDSAAYWYRYAVPVFQAMKSVNKEGAVYLNLVELYVNAGQMDSAEKYMDKARIAEPLWRGKPTMVDYLGLRAKVLLGQSSFAEAMLALREAEALSDGAPNTLYRLYQLRALAYAGQQRGDSAYSCLQQGNGLMLADLDLAKVRELAKVQAEFEHQKETVLAEARLSAERVKRRNALIGGSLLSVLLVVLAFFYHASRRSGRLLSEKNTEILRAQEQLVLSEKAREAERVRTRIASDIHDEIGSELTKITFMGRELERSVVDDPGASGQLASRIRMLSTEVGAKLGEVVWAVDPANEHVRDLVAQVHAHAQRMSAGTGIAVDLDLEHSGENRALDPASKRDLHLLIKEALHNALKHAGATRITVSLHTTPAGYGFRIQDDGQGFDPGTVREGGNGLRNMRQRAERLKARFNLTVDQGTLVEVEGNWL